MTIKDIGYPSHLPCKVCGAWHLSFHSPGRWYNGPYEVAYAEAVEEAAEL